MDFRPPKHNRPFGLHSLCANPGRHSIRLEKFDYTKPGGYFVTVVAHQRHNLFGKITDTTMQLNELGIIVAECWYAIPDHFRNVALEAFIVMPNHVHGVIVIRDDVGATPASPSPEQPPHGPIPGSIGAIVGSFKSAVSRRAGRELNTSAIWQRNYYEHIIRSEAEWENIRRYIETNPHNWTGDTENPIR
jgi:putative transposase